MSNPKQTPDAGAVPNKATEVNTAKRVGAWLWLKRGLRFCWRVALLFLLIVICAIGIAIGSLVTESGRLFWLEKALPLAQTPQFTVVLDNVKWPRLGDLQVGYALVTTGRNPLLEVTEARLRLSIGELWQKRLLVHELSAAALVVYQPEAKPKVPNDEPFTFTLNIPQLPAVKVESLSVKRLQLKGFKWPECRQCETAQKRVGPGALKITGAAALHWPNPLELALTVTENGQKTPLVWLEGHSESRDSLALSGRVQQAPGGWLGQWLRLPKTQAVKVELRAQAAQKGDAIAVQLTELSAPLFKQQLKLSGSVLARPEQQRLELEQLIVGINQQRHLLKGAISPERVALSADIQRFNLGLLQPWLADLEGGILSAKSDLVWDWNTQHLPQGSVDIASNVRYLQQSISLKSRLKLSTTQAQVQQLRASLGDMQLSAKGRVQLNDKPLALTFTATHLRDGPIRELLPPAIAEQIPEALTVHAQQIGGLVRGSLTDPQIIADVNIIGGYMGVPFVIYGNASADKHHADIGQLTVEADDASIALEGLLDWQGNNTDISGSVRHLSPALAYRAELPLPPNLAGFLNAQYQVRGPLTQPDVVLNALYQGGYEHQNVVLPFKLAVEASAKLGALKDIELDVDVMKLSVFKRPLVNIEGQLNARDNDFNVVVSRLPVQLLEALGYPVGEGRAEARLHFGGSFMEPTLGGYISYAEPLAVRAANDERKVVPLIWHANVSSEAKDLRIDSSFTLDKSSAGLLSLTLPWHNYLRYLADPSVGDLPTKGSIKADLDTSAFQLFMDTDQMTLQGNLEADLTLAGTAARPNVMGELLLKNGYFKHAATGSVLSDIQVYAVAEERRINLVTGFARDGEGGTLRAGGYVDWHDVTSASAVKLELTLKDANLVDMPNVKGAASGQIALAGGLQGMAVTGKLNVQPLNINIDSAPAVSIPELDVQEVYGPDAEADANDSRLPEITLDIVIDIENQAFVRGRGLETELEGKVLITGTRANPDIAGSFKTLRGEIKLLQKPIKLNEGRAQFSNSSFNFHIPATYQTGDIEINIVVLGNEEEIDLELSSVPSLPQEEILSRLLFGDSVQNISAWQAMSLASAVNKIRSGSSFDPIDATRDALGFDSLSVGQDSEEDGGGVNVGVGKYLNERVYLELERSSNPAQPWQGNLRIDLTEELRLNSSTASTGKSSAALEWRRDY
ncbi:MAG TPA: translocation/assembly module TamB domain-containing protein [Marinagarivorans sp.]